MKKLLFILAALCCTMVASAQSTPPNNEIWYTSTDGKVVTPNKANAFNVGITSNEYKNVKGILTFAGDLTSIGDWAFTSCSSLATIAIPSSVTGFGYAAFRDCTNLKSVAIKDGTTIGDYAFQNCAGLTSITVDSSIGKQAFRGCAGLTSITVGGSVGESAFLDCTNLKSVTVKDGTTIGESAFNGYKGEFIFEGCVTNVGGKGFQNCTGLTSITVSGSVGGYAFNGCTNLTVTIKDGTTIGEYAFNGYKGEFIFEGSVMNVGYMSFQNCTGLTSITVIGSVGGYAFADCANLKTVTVKDGTTIGEYAFNGYKGEFIFEGSVMNVGYMSFLNCTGLTSITVIGSVGGYAFNGCTNLESITINDCPNVGEDAFNGCTGLKSMVITSDAPPFLEDRVILFEGVNPDIPIYVCNVVAYSISEWGKYFTNFIVNLISYKSQAVNEINAQRQGITLSEEEAAAVEASIKTINDIPDGARMTDERLATIKKAEAAALAIINMDKFRKEKDAATAEVAALVPKGLEGDYLTEVLQEQMNAINAANTIVGLNVAKENATAVINKALAVCQAFLGTLGTKQSGHSVEVTDQNGQVIRLYNPKTVMFVKVKEDDADAPAE